MTNELGRLSIRALDLPATAAQKKALKALRPEALAANELAGEPIIAKLTRAPGNGAEIGGLKVRRPVAGLPYGPREPKICKIYAESLVGGALETDSRRGLEIAQSVFAASGQVTTS